MSKNLRWLSPPHKPVYATLAAIYLSACFGLDKTTVNALAMVAYALLAVGR